MKLCVFNLFPYYPFSMQRGWSNRECNLLSCKGLGGLSNLPLFVLRHHLDYEFAYKVTEESDRYLAGWLFWSYNKHGQKSPIIKLLHNYCCATDYVTNLLRVKEIIIVGLRDLVSSRSSRMNQICWSQQRTTIKMQYFLKFPPPLLFISIKKEIYTLQFSRLASVSYQQAGKIKLSITRSCPFPVLILSKPIEIKAIGNWRKHIHLLQVHGLMQFDSYTPVVISNRKNKIPEVPSTVVKEFEKHYMHLLNSLMNIIKYLPRTP